MARYCTNCGRELKEGEVCNCREQAENMQNMSVQEETSEKMQDESVQEEASEEGYIPSEEYSQQEDDFDENEKTVGYTQDDYSKRIYPQGNYSQEDYQQRDYQQRSYQQRNYQQGDYQQKNYQQGNYQQRNYQQGGYQQGNYHQNDYQQSSYQQRGRQQGDFQRGNYQQGSYQQKGRQQEDFQQGNYQQGGYQQSGYQQGNYQQGGYQQRNYQQGGYQREQYQNSHSMNGQWFSERRDDLVKHTKNIFAQIPRLICRPDTTMEAISKQNSSILGIEMISFQAVIMLVILLVGNFYLNSVTRGYFSFSPISIILFVLVMTFGTGYLEAGILTGISFAFKGKTSIHRMLCAVGYKALVQGLTLILTVLLLFLAWQPAFCVYLIGSMAAYLFFIDGYRNAVEIHNDRRMYAFLVGEILFILALLIILNFVATTLVTSVVGNYMDSYGGLMNGLLNELY